jgi:formate C-acetyltransferase
MIKLGAEGIIAEVEAFEAQTNDPSKLDFHQSVKISMNALTEFGDGYATRASTVTSRRCRVWKRPTRCETSWYSCA